MNFQSMNYFLQVAEKRSFSQAAEALYITQQTLSASIASLERELGCPLFVRHVPLELTYGGERFLRYAGSIMEIRERMLREFAEIRGEKRGLLRIGIAVNRSKMLMPSAARKFHENWPLIEIRIDERKNDELLPALYGGEIDLAVANFPADAHGIVTEEYYEAEVVLAVSEKLLRERFGDRAEEVKSELCMTQDLRLLSGVPFLMSNIQGVTGRIERNLIRQAGLTPEVRASSANIGTVMDMCVLGEGACFCPEDLLRTFPAGEEGLFVLRFPNGGTAYPVRFGWLPEQGEWSVRSAFIETAKKALPPGFSSSSAVFGTSEGRKDS